MSVNTTYPIGMGHTPRWEGIVLKILKKSFIKAWGMTASSNPLLRSQIKFTPSSYKKKTKE